MREPAGGTAPTRLQRALDAPRITGFAPKEAENAADHRFLLLRLGLSVADCETVLARNKAAGLPVELRRRLIERLGREREKLMRLARARSRAYDLNRHLAVRKALDWIGETATA